MRENKIEAYLVKKVEAMGGKCVKMSAQHHRGIPDRLILMPGGKARFVEVKADGGKPTKLQILALRKMNALGFPSIVVSSTSDVDAFLITMMIVDRLADRMSRSLPKITPKGGETVRGKGCEPVDLSKIGFCRSKPADLSKPFKDWAAYQEAAWARDKRLRDKMDEDLKPYAFKPVGMSEKDSLRWDRVTHLYKLRVGDGASADSLVPKLTELRKKYENAPPKYGGLPPVFDEETETGTYRGVGFKGWDAFAKAVNAGEGGQTKPGKPKKAKPYDDPPPGMSEDDIKRWAWLAEEHKQADDTLRRVQITAELCGIRNEYEIAEGSKKDLSKTDLGDLTIGKDGAVGSAPPEENNNDTLSV